VTELVGDGVLHVVTHAARGDVPRRAGRRVDDAQVGDGPVDLDVGVEDRAVRVVGDEGECQQPVPLVPAVVDVAAARGVDARVAGRHHRGAEPAPEEDQVLVRATRVVLDEAGAGVSPLAEIEIAAALELRLPGLRRAGDRVERTRPQPRRSLRALHEGQLPAGPGVDRPAEAMLAVGGLGPDVGERRRLAEEEPGEESGGGDTAHARHASCPRPAPRGVPSGNPGMGQPSPPGDSSLHHRVVEPPGTTGVWGRCGAMSGGNGAIPSSGVSGFGSDPDDRRLEVEPPTVHPGG